MPPEALRMDKQIGKYERRFLTHLRGDTFYLAKGLYGFHVPCRGI